MPEWDGPVPRHIAVIMDGNGRWAEARGLPRNEGHAAGAESVRQIVRACGDLGVEVLTLYSFSTENWLRPDEEVQALMALLEQYLRDETQELMLNKVRLSAIGEISRLPPTVQLGLTAASKVTEDNDGLHLVLALSYGGRNELVSAVRAIAGQAATGDLLPGDVTEETIGNHLYTAGLPDPDLVIRTSGELRLSNFLLWQVAYAEFYVTDVLWPDFRSPHLLDAFRAFSSRKRRYGLTQNQAEAVS